MRRTATHLLLVLSHFVALQLQAVNDYLSESAATRRSYTDSRMARSCFVIFGTDWFPPMKICVQDVSAGSCRVCVTERGSMWGNQEEASSLGRRATAHSAGPARHADHTKSLVVTLHPLALSNSYHMQTDWVSHEIYMETTRNLRQSRVLPLYISVRRPTSKQIYKNGNAVSRTTNAPTLGIHRCRTG